MFNKNTCQSCGKKIKDSFNFCPNCGGKTKKENLGLLGEQDTLNTHQPLLLPGPKPGILDSLIGKMVNSAFGAVEKELSKEMQKDLNNMMNMPKQNFQLMINGKKIDPASLGFGEPEKKEKPIRVNRILTDKKRKEIAALPKKDPKTNVRRLSDKIIYEMDVPGVKTLEDVSINQLENSIEIKALANKKAYEKIIQVGMPIKRYFLSSGKLTLELATN